MPDAASKHKLSAKQQLRICALLGVGYNPRVCADMFEEESGIKVSPTNLYNNYLQNKKWQKIIRHLAKKAESRVLTHALAGKVNRLNLLAKAANECLTFRLDKINYDKDGNELSRIEKRNVGIIPNIIREARAEIEGDKSIILDQSHHTHFYLPVKDNPAITNRIHEQIIS